MPDPKETSAQYESEEIGDELAAMLEGHPAEPEKKVQEVEELRATMGGADDGEKKETPAEDTTPPEETEPEGGEPEDKEEVAEPEPAPAEEAEEEAPSELDQLRADLEAAGTRESNLMKMLNESAGGYGVVRLTPPGAEVEPETVPVPPVGPTEVRAAPDLTQEQFAALFEDPKAFQEYLSGREERIRQRVLVEANERAVYAMQTRDSINTFFGRKDNEDLRPVMDHVVQTARIVETHKPDSTVIEVMEEAAKLVRERIGLSSAVARAEGGAPQVTRNRRTGAVGPKPGFAKTTRQRGRVPKKQEKTPDEDIADDIDAMGTLGSSVNAMLGR